MRTVTRKPIGLPSDGEHIVAGSYQEAAETLVELREEGYVVPQYAVDGLLEDAKEE